MKKIRTFLYVFRNSFIKPDYYLEVLKVGFSFSLKYFLFLFFCLSFITVVSFSSLMFAKAQPYMAKLKTEVINLYPDELELTIKDGTLATNVAEPYFIPLKPELFPQEIADGLKKQPIYNIIVIDAQANPADLKQYQTFILLTKNSLAYLQNRNEIRIQSLEEVKDFSLDKTKFSQAWQKAAPFIDWLIPGLIFLSLIFVPVFTIVSKLIYLCLFSLITLIIFKLFKLKKLKFVKAWQINLHAITLPTIVIALFQVLRAEIKIPFFSTIILLIFNLIIIATIKEKLKS